MNDLKKLLRIWTLSAIVTKILVVGSAVAVGVYVVSGGGFDAHITINKGVNDGK